MSILTRLLTKMVVSRFVAVLLGLTLFALMLDVLSNVDAILEYRNNEYTALAHYAALRFPQVVSTFWPLSLLLAVLLMLVELSWRNELVALWAAGLSPLRMIVMLLPLGLALGAANFLIDDRLTPLTAQELRQWGIGDYARKKRLQLGERDPMWMRAGRDIVRAEKINADMTEIDGMTIFRRDADGLLLEQIIAESAQLREGRWILRRVLVYNRDGTEPERLDVLVYSGNLRIAAAGARSGEPQEMSLASLQYFIANEGFGIRPVFVYEVWWHKRLSLLIAAWLVIAVCIPLSARYRRGGAVGYMFGAGIFIGFAFFIFDGISMTMGEMGLVPPWMAVWIPLIVLGLVAAALLLRAESVS